MAKKEKKEKKEKKVKKEKKKKSKVEEVSAEQENIEPNPEQTENLDNPEIVDEVDGLEEDLSNLSESQKAKLERLKSVKSKISRILKSENVEIVDENEGDDFDDEESSDSEIKKQQDYDSLKSVFGKGNKNKKQELTLTIDDFDYTYVGKYVDEYDLMHKKNIKKIKLPSKYAKVIKKVAIAVVFVAIVITGIFVGINMTEEKPYYPVDVVLSQNEQTYFAGETFDFTGLYLKVTYSNGSKSYEKNIDLKSDYYLASRSIGAFKHANSVFTFNEVSYETTATLAFNYANIVCEMQIKILVKNKNGITIKYTNGLFDLKAGYVLTEKNLVGLINYSNYNSERLNLNNFKVYIDGTEYSKDKGFELKADTTKDSNIVVEYIGNSEYKVEISYDSELSGIISKSYVVNTETPVK